MPAISPKLGEFLIKTTHAKDIDDAIRRVFSDYLDLKLEHLNKLIEQYKARWKMSFEEFQNHIKEETLGRNVYSYDTEKNFWEWEEVETLKAHYEELKSQWI